MDAAFQIITITANCSEPIPLAVLAVAAGAGVQAATASGAATVSGTLEATHGAEGWAGQARGRIAGIDLAAAATAVAAHDLYEAPW